MCATTTMAIPFNLPTDEETEDNYRRLDQLLLDLYHVLRQILMRPTNVPDTNTEDRGGGGPAPSGSRRVAADVTGSRRPDLPDVVSSAVSSACRCHRRRSQRRHRRGRPRSNCPLERVPQPQPVEPPLAAAPRQDESWLVIGERLKKIADEFRMMAKKDETPRENQEELKMEVKTSGLFSLLVPAHFRSSLWTTVILLVGWRLLVRGR